MQAKKSETVLVKKIDIELYQHVNGIDILAAVAPLNFREQKTAFFASNFSVNPEFVYAEHKIDLFNKKRALYNLPVDELADEDLVSLYSEVIESYVDKLDQYKSIGTPEFLYDSLRYYGEPSDKDIRNASFILHLPDDYDGKNQSLLGADEIVSKLDEFGKKQGYQFRIEMDHKMIANALVSGTVVKVNSAARVTDMEVNALAHHELGVHLVTTLNGRSQPLNVLSLGSPVNTTTQEGLAILCEYLSGFMNISRLKTLALRVIAVESMLKDKDFKRTFLLLKEQYNIAEDLAFSVTARVYRGGGLTKDYLYIQGFHLILNAYESRNDFENLLCGKVSLKQLPLVTRLIEKDYLRKPQYISPAVSAPQKIDDVRKFIAHAIKG